MLTHLLAVLSFWGSNVYVLGIASFCGIIGFILTIFVSIRTHSIDRILKQNQIAAQYNDEREKNQQKFSGHKDSILEDGVWSDTLLKRILQDVEGYQSKFGPILSISDRILLLRFKYILRKECCRVNKNTICNFLATLSGKLEKLGEIKHV